jgi:membrane associated rhomboid family serine protease
MNLWSSSVSQNQSEAVAAKSRNRVSLSRKASLCLTCMVGASGAVAGVMGAYFVLYPRSRVLTLFPFPLMLFEIPAVYLLGLWFVLQFVSGLGSLSATAEGAMAGGVAFWAHVAGFGTGIALVFLFRRPERQRVEWWDAADRPRTRP